MSIDLDRFRRAQADQLAGVATAIEELRSGRKQTHWMWYVFPQLAGLGSSTMSRRYGLQGIDEARAFFADPDLRAHLLRATTALEEGLAASSRASLIALLGSAIDVQKVVSSLTLFREIARRASLESRDVFSDFEARAGRLLSRADSEGFAPCRFTQQAFVGGQDR